MKTPHHMRRKPLEPVIASERPTLAYLKPGSTKEVLPAQTMLQQHQDDWIRPISPPADFDESFDSSSSSILVSEAGDFDVDVRAPELIAHEQRLEEEDAREELYHSRSTSDHVYKPDTTEAQMVRTESTHNQITGPSLIDDDNSLEQRHAYSEIPQHHDASRNAFNIETSHPNNIHSDAYSDDSFADGLNRRSASEHSSAFSDGVDADAQLQQAQAQPSTAYDKSAHSSHDNELFTKQKEKEDLILSEQRAQERVEEADKILTVLEDEVLNERARERVERAERASEAQRVSKTRANDSFPAAGTQGASKSIKSTKTNLGRPIRPSRIMAQPKTQIAKAKPVAIKVGTLSQRLPVNTAPVAVHNQDNTSSVATASSIRQSTQPHKVFRKNSVLVQKPLHASKPKPVLLAEKKNKETALRQQRQPQPPHRDHHATKAHGQDIPVAESSRQASMRALGRDDENIRAAPPPRPQARQGFHDELLDSTIAPVLTPPVRGQTRTRKDALNTVLASMDTYDAWLEEPIVFPPPQDNTVNTGHIELPDVDTDSESDESKDGFPVPDWATPGHIEAQLKRQAGVDGTAVFGPVARFNLEQTFARSDANRLARLRARTSSANWVSKGDHLVRREIIEDNIAQQLIAEHGKWDSSIEEAARREAKRQRMH